MDGITEISNYGMVDFFRDKLSAVSSTGKIVGAYDIIIKTMYYLTATQDRY